MNMSLQENFSLQITNNLHIDFPKGCVFAPAPLHSLSPYRLKFFHMQHHSGVSLRRGSSAVPRTYLHSSSSGTS